ncbi:MAG: GlsB/YeaQ/YmgE family stress response membrane protein [Aggregatilineales bacterium]
MDVILGIVGAWVGGFILGLLGFRDALDIGFGIGSLITALIGAIVLISIGRLVTGRR